MYTDGSHASCMMLYLIVHCMNGWELATNVAINENKVC